MVCDYRKICKDLEMEVDLSIECENVTVMRYRCTREDHIMLLCDIHAVKFSGCCPYHQGARMQYSVLDGPVPQ